MDAKVRFYCIDCRAVFALTWGQVGENCRKSPTSAVTCVNCGSLYTCSEGFDPVSRPREAAKMDQK